MNQPQKRRIVLIDHRFQLRMAAAFIALQVLLTALFSAGLYLFMDSEIHADLASAHASYQSLSQILLPIVLILAIFSVVLAIVLTTLFVVLISHKIAGPMYRFNIVLQALAQRRFEGMTRIRPDDQLGELAYSLDKALGVIRNDMHALQRCVAKLREAQLNNNLDAIATELSTAEILLNSWEKP